MSEQLAPNYLASLFTKGVSSSDSRTHLNRSVDVKDTASFGQTLAGLQLFDTAQTVAQLPLSSLQAPAVSKFLQNSPEGDDSQTLSPVGKSASTLARLSDSDQRVGWLAVELPITTQPQTTEGPNADRHAAKLLAVRLPTTALPDTESAAEGQREVALSEIQQPVTELRAANHLPSVALSSADLTVTELPATDQGATAPPVSQSPVVELLAVGHLPVTQGSSTGLTVTELPAADQGATTASPVSQSPVVELLAVGHLPGTEGSSAGLTGTGLPAAAQGATAPPVPRPPVAEQLAVDQLIATELPLAVAGSSIEGEFVSARTALKQPVTKLASTELQRLLSLGSANLKAMMLAGQTGTAYPELIQSETGKKLEMAPAEIARADREGGLWLSNEATESGPLMTGNSAKVADFLLPSTAMDTLRGDIQRAVIDVPLGKPRWEQSLGERILWLVNQKLQGAELQLNPPHLGPLDVQLSLDDEQMSLKFATPHALVREALESAIPRLREMLNDCGLNLVNVDVSQQNLTQQRHERLAPSHSSKRNKESDPIDQTMGSNEERVLHVGVGLVNYFA